MWQNRSDHAFHCYGELRNCVYWLLLKTREMESLPDIDEWDEYRDLSKLRPFPVVTAESFFVNCELGKELSEGKTSEFPEFRLRSREFVDRLIVLLVENSCAKAVIAKSIYRFCPELLWRAIKVLLLSCLRSWVMFLLVEGC